jgi:hemerythrin-like domain-containing protein
MDDITSYLSAGHKRCDDLLTQAESSVSERDWASANDLFTQFRDTLEQHFAMEEGLLFSAFEQRIGHTSGPTAIMRIEHAQMRDLLADMAGAIKYRRRNDYLRHSDTLGIMLEQHNMKEESILHPVTNNLLRDSQVEILDAVHGVLMTA